MSVSVLATTDVLGMFTYIEVFIESFGTLLLVPFQA